VTYHTGISDAALAALYRSAWIYASPSTYEGFGLPYLEAMACGTSVVASPNPGSKEVLEEGRYGLLADDPAFGEVLLALIDDAARRRELETAGLRRARELSLDAMLDRYETLLRKAS
jgi:glycosyltransferase involved in cell wall biosynthesis